MKRRTKIGENKPHPLYVPKQLADQGFRGDVDMYVNAKTFVVAHPKATLSEVEESLRIILRDLKLRKNDRN